MNYFGISSIVFYDYYQTCKVDLEAITLAGAPNTPLIPIFKNLISWVFQDRIRKRYVNLLTFSKNTKFYTLINEENETGDYELTWIVLNKLQDITEMAERGEKIVKVFVDHSYSNPLSVWYATQELHLKNLFLVSNKKNEEANNNENKEEVSDNKKTTKKDIIGMSGKSIAFYPFRHQTELEEIEEENDNKCEIFMNYISKRLPDNFKVVNDYVLIDNHIERCSKLDESRIGIIDKSTCFAYPKINPKYLPLLNPLLSPTNDEIKEIVTSSTMYLDGSVLVSLLVKDHLSELIQFEPRESNNNKNDDKNEEDDKNEDNDEGESEEEEEESSSNATCIIGTNDDNRTKNYGICFDCDMAEFDILLTNMQKVTNKLDMIIVVNTGWFAVAGDGDYYPYPPNGMWLALMDMNLNSNIKSYNNYVANLL
eukprot:TRINITY_DN345_c0_g1_i1.p1 TRINITY_DN345_c0_g1~~TRINITY_DN345_c0_g1_i1.p1  ORF type:complete len:457 (-),score=175.82 TRINITY_DN345_c0_g1_i1:92-1366(-)